MAGDTDFGIDLGVTGAAGYQAAAAATDTLADALATAGKAATAASDALAAGNASYATAETTANKAALALERIGVAAEAQRGKLQAALDVGDTSGAERAAAKLDNLLQRQAEAASKAESAKSALASEAAALDQLKAAASAAADQESALAKQEQEHIDAAKDVAKANASASDSAEGASVNFRALGGALGKLGGPLGSAGQSAAGFAGGVQKLTKSLGALGPYVAAAVVAVAIAAGFALATLAVAKFAITSADAARSSALLSDGIAGTVAGGKKLDDTIYALGAKVPQTRDELVSMASDLAKTGLKGDALSKALEDAAVKAAKLKWGPDFEKQTLSLTNQAARLHDNISGPNGIFSGLKIDGLLGGLSKIVALFDSTSVTGKAIKVVFESLFQPVIDQLTALEPKIVSTFIQAEIWALKAYLAVVPYSKQIDYVGKVLLTVAAIVVGVVAVAFGVLIAASIAFGTVLAGLIDGAVHIAEGFSSAAKAAYNFGASIIGGAGSAIGWLIGKVDAAMSWLEGLSLAEIGRQLIAGLASGITGGGSAITAAMSNTVNGAIDSAKKLLGIASPSKVFAEIGMNTAAGMAEGVQGGAPNVQGALSTMVAPPATQSANGASGGTSGKGTTNNGGHTFNINVGAGGDAKSTADAVKAAILQVLEDVATKVGGGDAPAGATA